jgi:DNA-binding NtrC family response regulator
MSNPPVHPAPYSLVVDGDVVVRMGAMDILEEAGFRTFEASDGNKALTLISKHESLIMLLFTGLKLPGSLNGFAVASQVARLWPHIAIVVASGDIRPLPGELPDGARFIPKPFSAEMVHAHLKEILPDGQKPEPLRT